MTIKDSADLLAWIRTTIPGTGSEHAIGTVQTVSPLNVSFDGEQDSSGNPVVQPIVFPHLSSYRARAGDRVLLIKFGAGWIIAGTIRTNTATPVYGYSGSPYAGSFDATKEPATFSGRANVTSDLNALVSVALTGVSAVLEADATTDNNGGALHHLVPRYDLITTSNVYWQLYNTAGTLLPTTGVVYRFTIVYQLT